MVRVRAPRRGTAHDPGVVRLAEGAWWVATARRNVKVRNVQQQDQVSLALPDADHPVVAQGRARIHWSEFPPEVSQAFAATYDDWDIASEEPDGPRVLIEVEASR